TQFMGAYGVYALTKALRLNQWADLIASISIDAFGGRLDPFNEKLHLIRPHKGQIETAKAIRQNLKGSKIANAKKKQVQDPYSFRCIPQVHGASRDAINYAKGVFEIEINSVT